ncbi:MAG: type II toxin-antitoxin system RelE/ParE family toxin [Leptospirales bacterium]|nr:type II toxin-antitoxin system RelE/ParE family toxin [Leptospirales bacterium]
MSIIIIEKKYKISKTEIFTEWFNDIENKLQKIIIDRLDRVAVGNFGDYKQLKDAKNIYELRIHYGTGYRLYFTQRDKVIIIILCGGGKSSQKQDIQRAKQILAEV